jgi:transcriptional regulator with XRE-family HTH domain
VAPHGDAHERTPAELVRELRGNWSHDKFAAALGTSRQTVIRWERGMIPRAYAQALSEYSGGRYRLEDFNPGLTGGTTRYVAAERLDALERRHADLEQRVEKLEKQMNRRRRA